ncbi:MAG: hypothetical protein QXH26_05030 [Candidatus Hadarchaeales archaeon]
MAGEIRPNKALKEIERFEEGIKKLRKRSDFFSKIRAGLWSWSRKVPAKLSLAMYQLDAKIYGEKEFFGNFNQQEARALARELRGLLENYKLPFLPYPDGKFKGNKAIIGGALALVCGLDERGEVCFNFRDKLGAPLRKKWVPHRQYLKDPLYDPTRYNDHYLIRLPISEMQLIDPSAQIGKVLHLYCQVLPAEIP